MFPQTHSPGQRALSDFTKLKDQVINVGGVALVHLLYHFRLAFSGWCHARVVLGGESFTALAEGLTDSLEHLGGVPAEHRTDSLSAAYRNLDPVAQEDVTKRYQTLCRHYGIDASRIRTERECLAPLPFQVGVNYTEAIVRATSSSTFTLRRVLYSVPARLINERLRIHLYDDRLIVHLGATEL
ncbi:MAG: IS21 family transposase, partial [Haliea sp.]